MLQERTGQDSRGSSLCPGGRRGSRPLGWPGRRALWETERKGVREKGGVLESPEV